MDHALRPVKSIEGYVLLLTGERIKACEDSRLHFYAKLKMIWCTGADHAANEFCTSFVNYNGQSHHRMIAWCGLYPWQRRVRSASRCSLVSADS